MIGKTISRYRILEKVGAGGMGEVYRARDDKLERDVAIKVLPPGMLADPTARGRFRKEALSLARVNFPNIATIHDFGSEDGVDFLVTEFIPGITLDAKLHVTRLEVPEVLQLGMQLAKGLAAAHQHGIVHRDLKPSNLRITPDGRLKILDFGLAQFAFALQGNDLIKTVTLTKSTELTGTLPYMAPEQLKGEAADSRSDLWAAGTVLYEMATGRRPFPQNHGPLLINAILNKQPAPPSSVSPDIPANLENVILKALEKDPARRYQSATEMYVDLERIAHPSVQGLQRTDSETSRLARERQSRNALLLKVGLAALLITGLCVAGYVAKQALEHKNSIAATNALAGRRSVAVWGFKNLSGKPEQKWLSDALSEMLTAELSAGDKLKTVAGENVARAKADLSLADSDSFSPQTLSGIYQRLGSNLVVLGSYLDVAGQVRVDIRVQDTAKGETVATLSSSVPDSKLLDLVKDLGIRLREKCGAGVITDEEAAEVRAAQPDTPDAARLYAEGVAKLRSFDNLGARQSLEQAVAAEPSNALAHLALARAWGELGYDAKAETEAKRAFELSKGLSRKESLLIEANYREAARDWSRAVELYKSLWTFYPDELEYGLRLADVQVSAGQPQDSLETVARLRHLPSPLREDPRIYLSEAKAHAAVGEYQPALSAAEQAGKKAQSLGARFLRAQAQLEQCQDLRGLGQYALAKSMGEEANRTFEGTGDSRSQAKSLTCIANVAADQGNLADARSMHEKALALARKIGAQNDVAGALINLGNSLATNGDLPQSSLQYKEALTVAQAAGDYSDALVAQSNLGVNLLSQGQLDEARKQFEASAGTAEQLGDQWRMVEAQLNLGIVAFLQGRLENARDHAQSALRKSQDLHLKSDQAISLMQLGDVLLAENDLKEASKYYQEALDLRTQLGEKGTIAATNVSRAALSLEENRAPAAEALAQQASEEFRTENSPGQELAARDVLAQALLAQGKVKDASTEVNQAAQLTVTDLSTQLSFEITRGRVSARAGNPADGLAKIVAAGERAKQIGMIPYALQARLAAAEIQIAQCDAASARTDLTSLHSEASRLKYNLIASKAQAVAKASSIEKAPSCQ